MSVAWNDIDPLDKVVLTNLPEGFVLMTPGSVERCYQPPLTVQGVLHRSVDAKRSFEAVSYFSRGARRGVVVPRKRVSHAIAARAKRLGIGLALEDAGSAHVLVPSSRAHIRFDEITWLITETIYEQIADLYSPAAQARS
jgi:hypothetical protein